MWFKKNQEKQILNEMKKKKQQIEKLKEDMNKMAKLVLKDGRLQKVEEKRDVIKSEEELAVPISPMAKQVPNFDIKVPTFNNEEIIEEKLSNEILQEQQRRLYEQQVAQEQQRRLYEQQVAQEQQRRLYEQQVAQEQQRRLYEQQVGQTMNIINKPTQQESTIIKVTIETVGGGTFNVGVPEEHISKFLADLDIAINSQVIFPLNNRIINGRNIVSYLIE
jgi:hypothetical protein